MTTSDTTDFDAGVIGAGPAGLASAVLLALSGLRVVLFGPSDANRADTRTSALFVSSVRLLEHAGVWSDIAPSGCALQTVRIVDRISRPDHPSVVLFDAREIGEDPFGFNVPNDVLAEKLEQRFAAIGDARRIACPVRAIEHGEDRARLIAEDGTGVTVRLIVAADGRNSSARAAAGISATQWDYRQSALATRISHELEHDRISTEVHRAGGPFTSVPLPGRNSAIVWLGKPDEIDRACSGGTAALERLMEDILGGVLGRVELAGSLGRFPVRGLTVTSLARARTALVGEAGHVVPPIGAQGLNLGLRDAAWIAEIAGAAAARGQDPGGEAVLARYRDMRGRDALSRRAATDLLNRSLLLDTGLVRGIRGLGLAALAAIGPLRRSVMRAGVVRDRDLPVLMRSSA